jgi:hypothetical protein
MARIRSIKPDFWTDSKIVSLPPLARLFYIGLWNFAICDMGHIKDDPDALKLQILPTDDVDGAVVIDQLLKAGRVVRVDVPGDRHYLHIPRFTDHQNLSKRWSPRCPACMEQQPKMLNVGQSSADVLNFDEVSPKMTRRGREGRGREKNTSSPAPRATDDEVDFSRFWEAYPRKIGKGEARKAWAKVTKAGTDAAIIIAGAERYRDDPARRRKEIEFTKHPGPWLNAERWTDQLNGNDLAPSSGWWDN